jgi:hypothetical protein
MMTSLISCTTIQEQVTVESNKDSGYQGLSGKLFVVIDTEDTEINIPKKVIEKTPGGTEVTSTEIVKGSLNEYLRSSIENSFNQFGVPTKAVVPTGLELNGNEIEESRLAFGADTLMVIKRTGEKVDVAQTAGYTTSTGSYSSSGYHTTTTYHSGTTITTITYFFETTIQDALLNKKVWRSKQSIRGAFYPGTVDEFTHDLVSAMNSDGILGLREHEIPAYQEKGKDYATPILWIVLGALGVGLGILSASIGP